MSFMTPKVAIYMSVSQMNVFTLQMYCVVSYRKWVGKISREKRNMK